VTSIGPDQLSRDSVKDVPVGPVLLATQLVKAYARRPERLRDAVVAQLLTPSGAIPLIRLSASSLGTLENLPKEAPRQAAGHSLV
jgi:hypothetical protein